MRKFFIMLLFVAVSCGLSYSQIDERKGYISFGAGLNIPTGDYAYGGGKDAKKSFQDSDLDAFVKPGVHLNLVNFGYLFWENYVGMCASFNGGVNKHDMGGDDDPSYGGYTNLMVGPMGSYPVAEFFQVDLRPMIGLGLGFTPGIGDDDFKVGAGLAYGVGATFRFNLASRFAIHLNLDWFKSDCGYETEVTNFYGKTTTEEVDFNISAFTAGISFAVRLGN